MQHLGKICIKIDDPSCVTDPDTYGLSVSFTFGASQLMVSGIDNQTNRQAQTTVTFTAQ